MNNHAKTQKSTFGDLAEEMKIMVLKDMLSATNVRKDWNKWISNPLISKQKWQINFEYVRQRNFKRSRKGEVIPNVERDCISMLVSCQRRFSKIRIKGMGNPFEK
jgi:hypothetical protein